MDPSPVSDMPVQYRFSMHIFDWLTSLSFLLEIWIHEQVDVTVARVIFVRVPKVDKLGSIDAMPGSKIMILWPRYYIDSRATVPDAYIKSRDLP